MGLNKDTNYNTNFLTGKKISNISLEYFDENKISYDTFLVQELIKGFNIFTILYFF